MCKYVYILLPPKKTRNTQSFLETRENMYGRLSQFEINCYSRDLSTKAFIHANGYDTIANVKRQLPDEMGRRAGNYEAKHFDLFLLRSGQRILLNDHSTLYDCLQQRERTTRSVGVELVLKS